MATKKCKGCGAEIASSTKICIQCGTRLKHNRSMVFLPVIIFLIILIIIGYVGENDTSETSSNIKSNTISEQKVDKSKVIYNKNNILIKITDYTYHAFTGSLEIKLYIENNSKKDLSFTIDGDVTLNDYTTDAYFYEVVNQGTKSNKSFTVYGLNENNIKEDDLSKMKFKLDIYHSENYYIDERIENNYKIEYKFN